MHLTAINRSIQPNTPLGVVSRLCHTVLQFPIAMFFQMLAPPQEEKITTILPNHPDSSPYSLTAAIIILITIAFLRQTGKPVL